MVALPYVSLSHDISRCSRNRKLFYYGWKMQPSSVTKSVNSQRQPQLLIQEAPISPSLSILCFSFDLLGPSDSQPHSIWPIICPAYKNIGVNVGQRLWEWPINDLSSLKPIPWVWAHLWHWVPEPREWTAQRSRTKPTMTDKKKWNHSWPYSSIFIDRF